MFIMLPAFVILFNACCYQFAASPRKLLTCTFGNPIAIGSMQQFQLNPNYSFTKRSYGTLSPICKPLPTRPPYRDASWVAGKRKVNCVPCANADAVGHSLWRRHEAKAQALVTPGDPYAAQH